MARAEGIIVVLLHDASVRDDGADRAQVVGDVVVHQIRTAALADASPAEGDALQGLGSVRGVGVGEGPGIVVPCSCSVERRGFRPVGEVCVVGFHGGPGLDLCRQVKQIVGRLQGIGGIGSDIAVDVVGERVAIIPGVGIRQGRG